jgi:hypothetical protein
MCRAEVSDAGRTLQAITSQPAKRGYFPIYLESKLAFAGVEMMTRPESTRERFDAIAKEARRLAMRLEAKEFKNGSQRQ